ncbi:MAG: glycosyltransferase family 9 protein [Planctomycetota bacterium]
MSLANEMKKQIDRAFGVPLVLLLRSADSLLGRRQRPMPGNPERILIVKLWGVGNLAMLLPLARAVREQAAEARLEFLTLDRNREFLEAVPWIDRVHLFRSRGLLGPLLSLARLALRLRRRRFDLVIDCEQFLRTSAILIRLSRPGASVGYRTRGQMRHGLHDISVEHDCGRHMASVFADLFRAAGFDLGPLSPPLLPLVPRSSAAASRVDEIAREWDRGERRLVALHVGSGDNFIGRRWPIARFAALSDRLVRDALALIVFTGTDDERALVAACRSRMKESSVDASGRFGIVELVEFLSRVDLLVTNDTAPAHLGSALGVNLIGIYGPNTPALYGPLHPSARVFHAGLACSPCITNTNAKTSYCRKPVCMTSIPSAEVEEAALSLLRASMAPLAPGRGVAAGQR